MKTLENITMVDLISSNISPYSALDNACADGCGGREGCGGCIGVN